MNIDTKIAIQKQIEIAVNNMEAMQNTGFLSQSFVRHFSQPMSLNVIHELFHLDRIPGLVGNDIEGFELSIDDEGTYALKWYLVTMDDKLFSYDDINESLNETRDPTDVMYYITALSTETFDELLNFENQAKAQ